MRFEQSNYLMDEIMPNVKPTTFKVICAIARQTWGYPNKPQAIQLSQKDLADLTGISSPNTVKAAIDEALTYINQEPAGNQGYTYSMKPIPETLSKNDRVEPETVSNSDTSNSDTLSKNDREPYQILTPTLSNFDTPSYKRKEKEKNIYNRAHDDVAEMMSVIAAVVKTPLGVGVNEESFEDAAFALIGWDATHEDVRAFGDWWRENGHYSGLPALRSLVTEFRNFKQGATKQVGKQQLANQIWDIVRRYGRSGYHEAMAALNGSSQYVKSIGKWTYVCGLREDEFKVAFYQAYNRVNSHGTTTATA